MDRFSNSDKVLDQKAGDGLIGMSFKTRGMLFFRTSGLASGFVIGARKTNVRNQETALSGLTKADIVDFKAKLELGRQWAEVQAP